MSHESTQSVLPPEPDTAPRVDDLDPDNIETRMVRQAQQVLDEDPVFVDADQKIAEFRAREAAGLVKKPGEKQVTVEGAEAVQAEQSGLVAGAKDVARGVAHAVPTAMDETVEGGLTLLSTLGLIDPHEGEITTFQDTVANWLVAKPKGVAGDVAQGMAQFILPFGVMQKLNSASLAIKLMGLKNNPIAQAAINGAVLDYFAFDGSNQNLMNLADQLLKWGVPEGELPEFLAIFQTDPSRPENINRFVNAATGIPLGVGLDKAYQLWQGRRAVRAHMEKLRGEPQAKPGAPEAPASAQATPEPAPVQEPRPRIRFGPGGARAVLDQEVASARSILGSEGGYLRLELVDQLMQGTKLAVKDRNELARIGAAYIARGFRDYEDWKAAFLGGEFGADTFYRASGTSPPIGAESISSAAKQALSSHEQFQGSTVHLAKGNRAGDDVVAVALPGERSFPRPLTEQDIAQFISDHRQVLEDPRFRESMNVGTWVNSKTGNHEIALTVTVPDRAAAAQLGQEWNQISVFDLKSMSEIPTGGTGRPDPGLSLESALARVQQLAPTPPAAIPDDAQIRKLHEQASKEYANILQSKIGEKLVNARTLISLSKKREWAGGWYNLAWRELREQFGDDADLVARLIAALSPRKMVVEDVQDALDIYARWKSGVGDPIPAWAYKVDSKGNPNAWIGNIKKALAGQEFDEATSPKVFNFYRNIIGDPNAVTIDGWMGTLLFGRGGFSEGQYQFGAALVRQLAAARGVTPREMQAALWVAHKTKDALKDAAKTGYFKDPIIENGRKVGERIVKFPDEEMELIEGLDRTIKRLWETRGR